MGGDCQVEYKSGTQKSPGVPKKAHAKQFSLDKKSSSSRERKMPCVA